MSSAANWHAAFRSLIAAKNGQIDGHRQRQYPFSLESHGVKMRWKMSAKCWSFYWDLLEQEECDEGDCDEKLSGEDKVNLKQGWILQLGTPQ